MNSVKVVIGRLDQADSQEHYVAIVGDYFLAAKVGDRWVTPEDDSYGFASWIRQHARELVKLGVGEHVHECWGNFRKVR